MGVKRCFGLPDDFSAPIWHLKLGKCAIVLGRVYALLIFASFAVLSCVYVYQNPYTIHKSMFDRPEGSESHLINSTWPQYLETCSGEKIIENQVHAAHIFSQLYQDNIVEWDGYYIDTKSKHYQGLGVHQDMSILVKMNPSESDEFADIILSIGETAFQAHKDTLAALQKGDHLRFRARIRSMGNEFKLHHLRLENEVGSLTDTG